MKILQINTFCGYGSTGRIVTDIEEILIKEKNESLIAYGIGRDLNDNNSIKIDKNIEVHVHSILSQLFDMQGRASYFATKRLIKKIKEYNPDIIHLHNLHGCYLNIKLLFKYFKKTNKPIVWTLHDCWAFTGHCAHFDYAQCMKWKKMCESCPQKKVYPRNIFINRTKQNYKFKKKVFGGCKNLTIVTPSKWLANLVKESFLKEYDVKVINNGIDLRKFKPVKSDFRKKYKLEDKFIILGVASSWSDKKGLQYFIKLKEKLNSNYKIVLVGVDRNQDKQISKDIITISKTNDINDLAEMYTMADVFVNPTLEDTFPTTNLESLACGTPVITFNTGGSPESIDEKCGLVIEKGNFGELYKAIMKLREEKIEIKDCIKKSKYYDKKDKYKEYIELYTKIMNGEKKSERK